MTRTNQYRTLQYLPDSVSSGLHTYTSSVYPVLIDSFDICRQFVGETIGVLFAVSKAESYTQGGWCLRPFLNYGSNHDGALYGNCDTWRLYLCISKELHVLVSNIHDIVLTAFTNAFLATLGLLGSDMPVLHRRHQVSTRWSTIVWKNLIMEQGFRITDYLISIDMFGRVLYGQSPPQIQQAAYKVPYGVGWIPHNSCYAYRNPSSGAPALSATTRPHVTQGGG